jgi:para-aminobenzoate synthetase component 1
MFVYDFVLAMDQLVGKGWLICQGWPGRDSTERRSNGRVRLQQVLRWLGEPESDTRENGDVFGSVSVGGSGRKIGVCGNARVQGMAGIGNGEIRSVPDSAMNRIDGRLEMYSNFSRNEYLDAIDRAVEYVRAGDIFQVNLSQRLLVPAATSSPELFLQLRRANPAPFSGYLDLGDTQLISASPERLVSRRGGVLETRPIKGTRLRTGFPEVDLARCQELVESEKDRAENVMIVDLMRNDLSRVCRPNSVLVSQLCGVERFQDVIHLVSVVRGEISEGMDNFDVLCCLFPGGSITGAPKIRAMQIIAELEPTARGFYCGSLGYFGCGGEMDFNILIRSVTAKDGWWQIPVGGGITSDSIPELEYQETWAKAVGMLRAVSRAAGGREGELAAAAAATGGL